MRAVREAIFEVLDGSSELEDLATGGLHWNKAPQDTQPPLVIVTMMSGVRLWTFDGPPLRNQKYLVKGVGNPVDAEDIDDLCLELLTDASLSVDGHTVHLAPLPEEDVSYEDQQYGENYQHEGTMYRIVVERAQS